MVEISKYLDPNTIAFLDVGSRDEAIKALVDVAYQYGKLIDKDAFYQAIMDREKIVSTGIGMGTAIPHAKLAGYDDFFIIIGIVNRGVEWHALDGAPVRFIFLIGGPDDRQTEYLQILSGLTQIIKEEKIRKKMLTLKSATDMMQIF